MAEAEPVAEPEKADTKSEKKKKKDKKKSKKERHQTVTPEKVPQLEAIKPIIPKEVTQQIKKVTDVPMTNEEANKKGHQRQKEKPKISEEQILKDKKQKLAAVKTVPSTTAPIKQKKEKNDDMTLLKELPATKKSEFKKADPIL